MGRSGFRIAFDYASELRARGLQVLADEDEKAAVVFDLSWRFLSKQAQELFTALALAPGESIGVNLATAWLRRGEAKVSGPLPARLLAELANASLLIPGEGKRYRYHDRVRDYARSRLAHSEAAVRARLMECYIDWDMVKAEFDAVGAFDLAGQYFRLREGNEDRPVDFVAWFHFVRGQASVLRTQPELFFQQAFNEPQDSPVSQAALARIGTSAEPERWLEWANRPEKFAPPSCQVALRGHTSEVHAVAVTSDGRTAISGSGDNTVRVWDLRTGSCSAVLKGHTDVVYAVAVSADGWTAGAGSDDNTVCVWDLRTGSCSAVLKGHTSYVTAVAVTADGRTAVSGSSDYTVRVWDPRTGSCPAVLKGHTSYVTAVAATADGRTAVSGSWDTTVRVWDLGTGSCSTLLRGHTNSVAAVAVTADGRTAVSGSSDNTVCVWDLRTGSCFALPKGHTSGVVAVAVTADGQTAVSGSWDYTVRVWDLRTGSCSAVLKGHTNYVTAVAVTADGQTAVSGSNDSKVCIWDLRTGSCSAVHPAYSPEAKAAWTSVRGNGLCNVAVDNNGIRLSRDTGTILAHFPGSFRCANCSHTGTFVAVGDVHGRVYCLRLRGSGT
jgi:WD40 repeat protein